MIGEILFDDDLFEKINEKFLENDEQLSNEKYDFSKIFLSIPSGMEGKPSMEEAYNTYKKNRSATQGKLSFFITWGMAKLYDDSIDMCNISNRKNANDEQRKLFKTFNQTVNDWVNNKTIPCTPGSTRWIDLFVFIQKTTGYFTPDLAKDYPQKINKKLYQLGNQTVTGLYVRSLSDLAMLVTLFKEQNMNFYESLRKDLIDIYNSCRGRNEALEYDDRGTIENYKMIMEILKNPTNTVKDVVTIVKDIVRKNFGDFYDGKNRLLVCEGDGNYCIYYHDTLLDAFSTRTHWEEHRYLSLSWLAQKNKETNLFRRMQSEVNIDGKYRCTLENELEVKAIRAVYIVAKIESVLRHNQVNKEMYKRIIIQVNDKLINNGLRPLMRDQDKLIFDWYVLEAFQLCISK